MDLFKYASWINLRKNWRSSWLLHTCSKTTMNIFSSATVKWRLPHPIKNGFYLKPSITRLSRSLRESSEPGSIRYLSHFSTIVKQKFPSRQNPKKFFAFLIFGYRRAVDKNFFEGWSILQFRAVKILISWGCIYLDKFFHSLWWSICKPWEANEMLF